MDQDKYADDITEFEKTTLSSSECYKFDVHLGVTKRAMRFNTATFDTRTGQNLIREDVLPPDSQKCIKTFKTPLRSARDMTFSVKGVLRLQVDVGEKFFSTIFEIASVPASEAILGTAFIDEHIKSIETWRRSIVPRKGTSTPILASPSKKGNSHLGEELK